MNRAVWAWVRTLGGVGILALLVWRLGSVGFLDGLRKINAAALLGAFLIGLVGTVASAWRWALAARGLGIRLRLRDAVADYYQALFLNATLPGGLLGDVHRAVQNGRESGNVGRGVRAVMLERFAGQVILFAVGAFVLVVRPTIPLPAMRLSPVPVLAGSLLLVVAVAAGVRWRRALAAIGSDVRRGLLGRRNLPGVTISSALVLASHLATFVLAAKVAGATVPIVALLPLMVLALVVMGLPLSVGGWGPREGFCAWAFGAAGFGATQGLTVAVIYGVFAFAASLPGVAVLAARLLAKRPHRSAQRPRLLAIEPEPIRIRHLEPVAA